MNIQLRKTSSGKRRDDKFSADLRDLPGSPTLGFGATEAEAIADLFRATVYDNQYRELMPMIDAETLEIHRDYEVEG